MKDTERGYFDDADERARCFTATVSNKGQRYSYRTGFIHGARAYNRQPGLIEWSKPYSPAWISVEDSLPRDNKLCLVCDKLGVVEKVMHNIDGRFIDHNGNQYDAAHWQPLPKPPIQ